MLSLVLERVRREKMSEEKLVRKKKRFYRLCV